MMIEQSALAFALVLLVLDLVQPGPLFSQGTGAGTAAQPPDAAEPASPPTTAPMGGCDTTGVSLSRPWIGRNGQVEWWTWGFAYGTSVGLQVMDPSGRTTAAGSVLVDSGCEAGGVLAAQNRLPGLYTLIITGTRAGGGANEVSSSVRVVSMPAASSPGSVIPPAPAPTPGPPPPCQATTATLCP